MKGSKKMDSNSNEEIILLAFTKAAALSHLLSNLECKAHFKPGCISVAINAKVGLGQTFANCVTISIFSSFVCFVLSFPDLFN